MDVQPRKEEYESDLRQVVESLSKQPEWRDRGFWKEYFYWSLRCVPFYVFLVFASNYNSLDGLLGSVDHLSLTQWMIGIGIAFFFFPALGLGIAVAYWKIHEFGDRFRTPKNDR